VKFDLPKANKIDRDWNCVELPAKTKFCWELDNWRSHSTN